MRTIGFISSLRVLALLPVAVLINGCSEDLSENHVVNDYDGEIAPVVVRAEVNPIGSSNDVTRARSVSKADFTTFSLYAVNNKTIQWNNVLYTRDVTTGKCTPNKTVKWISGKDLDIYGIYPKSNVVSLIKMNVASNRNFTYTVPGVVENQTDLMVGSRLKMNENKLTNGALVMSYTHALSLMKLSAKLMIKDAIVYIKSIEVHNMATKGVFTFDNTKENTGTWAPAKTYAVMTENYDTARTTLKSYSTIYSLTHSDSVITVIPQTNKKWTNTKLKRVPIATADANRHTYLAITAKIYDTDQKKWIMGYKDNSLENDPDPDKQRPEFRTSYFVLPNRTWKMNEPYTVVINYDAGFDEDGYAWFPKHQEKEIPEDFVPEFLPEQNLDFNVIIEEGWTHDTDNSAEILF